MHLPTLDLELVDASTDSDLELVDASTDPKTIAYHTDCPMSEELT